MNPFHPAAAAFPQPTAHTAESLSAAVAAKSEQIAAAHKDASGGGPPNQIPGSQVSEHFFIVQTFFFRSATLRSAYIIHPTTACVCCGKRSNKFHEYSSDGLGRYMVAVYPFKCIE